ncbi:restriction endonuclease subunit S [Halorubrum sp. DTA46]|uniref:restriction endonuclease subunit S n=1 Tax=Halorubrum sp. DTA46 TaxID=3402162 RepID=UPI003AAFB996
MQETQETTIQEFESEGNGRYDKYPDYKEIDRSLPTVPDHWEVRRLKFCAKINPSKNEVEDLDPETEVTFLPMENVSEQGEINREETDLLEEVIDGYTYFKDGDVLVAKITPCFENGKGALAKDLKNGIGFGTTEFVVLRPYGQLNNEFAYYVTASNLFRKVGEGRMKGAAGQKRVPDEFFQNFPQPLPPEEEQHAIVEFLDRETDRIKDLIGKMERLIDLIKEEKETIIKDAVIKGLDSDVEMRESGVDWLGAVPTHWDVPRIRFVARMESGHTPSQSEDEYWDGDIPWVSLADSGRMRENDYISETEKQITEEGLANSSARILPPETMVFTRDATVGLCAITTREMAVSQHIIGWICEDNLLPEYLLNVTKAMDQELDRLTMGATISTVGMEDIKKLKMPLPPIEEQEEIVDHLNEELGKFDESIEKIQEGIDRLKEYRTALLTNAVTGQIDVRGEV